MPKPAKGRKSVPWDQDPEILKRLADVQDQMLRGKKNTEIAASVGVNEATIRRDAQRVAVLLRRRATDDILYLRQRSIALVRMVQREAWESWDQMKQASDDKKLDEDGKVKQELYRGRQLAIVLEGERMVVDLEGTKTPVAQPVTFPDGRLPLNQFSSAELIQRAAELESIAKSLLEEKSKPAAG